MTLVRSDKDLFLIKDSGKIIKEFFVLLEKKVTEGVSTLDLDMLAEDFIRSHDAKPAFKGYKGFPATICASVNEVVVHGIPSDKMILKEGDIIGVDVGVEKNGFFTDAARTYIVGEAKAEAKKLIENTRLALKRGIEKAITGNRISDISCAIQEVASGSGFEEVRTFVGHGVGRNLHEAPEVPNWGEKGKGLVLKEGLVLAIEPMFNAGTRDVKILSDGWTAVTRDGKLSAHFEDTVIVGAKEAEILT